MTSGREGSDGIRHVEAEYRLAGARVLHAIGIAEVGAKGAEVLFAERSHAGEGRGGDVEHSDRIGLLKRDHGLRAIRGNSQVFRLEVDGRHTVFIEAHASGFQGCGLGIEGREVSGLHGSWQASGIDRDDAHRSLRGIRHGGFDGDFGCGKLAFIANEQFGAIGRPGDVIRHDADGGVTDKSTRRGIEENHVTGAGLWIVDDGSGEHARIGTRTFAHSHGRNVIADDGRNAECGRRDGADEDGSGWVGEIHHLDARVR